MSKTQTQKQETQKQETQKQETQTNFTMFKREVKENFLQSFYFRGLAEVYVASTRGDVLYPTLDEEQSMEKLTVVDTLGILNSLYYKNIIDRDNILFMEKRAYSVNFFDKLNEFIIKKTEEQTQQNINAFKTLVDDTLENGYKVFSLKPYTREEYQELLSKVEDAKIKKNDDLLNSLPF